jgi:hypothetical protein
LPCAGSLPLVCIMIFIHWPAITDGYIDYKRLHE